jgi:hypothetical protein
MAEEVNKGRSENDLIRFTQPQTLKLFVLHKQLFPHGPRRKWFGWCFLVAIAFFLVGRVLWRGDYDASESKAGPPNFCIADYSADFTLVGAPVL